MIDIHGNELQIYADKNVPIQPVTMLEKVAYIASEFGHVVSYTQHSIQTASDGQKYARWSGFCTECGEESSVTLYGSEGVPDRMSCEAVRYAKNARN